MSEKVKQATDYCIKNNQKHLVEFMKPVFSSKSDKFARQLLSVDLKEINELYESLYKSSNNENQNESSLSPMKSIHAGKLSSEKKALFEDAGLNSISKSEIAVVTMAGGQGTRLGHNGPKGTFMLQTTPPISLFEIQCNQLKKLKEKTGVAIPWLIMTSEENNKATIEFFELNYYFGYDYDKVKFFAQDMIPLIDFDGNVLVGETGVALGPNGNGGIFSSLIKSGKYEWLKSLGVTKVFVCGIDNAIVKVADPLFIGFSIDQGKSVTCKSALKRSYDEKAGVFCYQNNRPSYIEYTEIDENSAKAVDENGEYLYGDIGIVMYVFNMDVLDDIAKSPLPYHIAMKKTTHYLSNGEKIVPIEPNSIKFEAFIFDSFAKVSDIALLRVERETEFAPIKNKDGEDSPQTALDMYNKKLLQSN